MAVAQMTKVMIVSHRSEVRKLLADIQQAGIMQVLDAQRAMVTKEWPELILEASKHRQIEEILGKLETAIDFLNQNTPKEQKPSALRPLVEVDNQEYCKIISDESALDTLEQCLQCQGQIAKTQEQIEHTNTIISHLLPWQKLECNVENITQFQSSSIIAGMLNKQNFNQVLENLEQMGAVLDVVNENKTSVYCVIACLSKDAVAVNKELRNADFETANFEKIKGTVSDNLNRLRQELSDFEKKLQVLKDKAVDLVRHKVELSVLYEYYTNLHNREETTCSAPATDHAVLLEGWVRQKDFKGLEGILSKYSASSLSAMGLGEDEQPPVEIDNNAAVKPFETITRLHGMPNIGDVDPTVFLAPFFALFFGICLTDAGYGIIMAIAFWWLIRKIQGDKKAIWMFLICSFTTIIAGALTGGWFGDAFSTLIPADTAAYRAINGVREKMMLFDPMKEPMTFFVIAIGLGYFQIMFALVIGFFNNLFRKDYATAVFNHLVWLVFLNSLLVFGVSKAGVWSANVGSIAGWIAVVQAVLIFWFSERKSGLAGRLGGGVFALFSTVFYFGDVLSYVRLMALGMVTAGLGMAVNILVKLVMEVPYVGFILGAVLFVGGHLLNIVLSVLSSFVHSLRLQFVEFFPKFFTGGGQEFKPLSLAYKYTMPKSGNS